MAEDLAKLQVKLEAQADEYVKEIKRADSETKKSSCQHDKRNRAPEKAVFQYGYVEKYRKIDCRFRETCDSKHQSYEC